MRNKSLKNSVFSGLFWMFGERIFAQGISFVVTVVLSRILMPDDYGTVALVSIFITLADVFIISGLNTALIQKKDANEIDYSTNFWCSFMLSIILYFILFFCAPIISKFYNNNALTIIIRVFSLRLFLASYNSVQRAYVQKHMIFKKFFFSTIIGTTLSGLVGIVLAYMGFGVWALVAQYFTNSIIDIIVLNITVPWKPKLLFSIDSAKKMVNFGWKVLAADLIGTFFDQLRSLIIGHFYTSADLAFYNKGKSLPNLISGNISSTIISVLFPAISNVSDNIIMVKAAIRRAIKIMAYVIFPMMFGLAAVAKPLIIVLFTDKWSECIPYVQILSISSAVSLIGSTSLQALKAIGRSDTLLSLEIYKKPFYLLLLLLGMKISVLAVALTMLLYSTYATLINVVPLKKFLNYTYKEQFIDLFPIFLLSFFMAVVVFIFNFLNINYYAMLLFQIILGIIIYIGFSYVFKFESFIYLLDFVKERTKRNL